VTRQLALAARDACRRGGKNGGARMSHPRSSSGFRSDGPDLVGLRALGAAAGRVLDPLIFLEAAVAVSLDGGVVDEDVGSAVVGGDESVALVGVEPLHFALSHYFLLRRSSGPRARARAAAIACLRKPGSGIHGAAVRISQAL